MNRLFITMLLVMLCMSKSIAASDSDDVALEVGKQATSAKTTQTLEELSNALKGKGAYEKYSDSEYLKKLKLKSAGRLETILDKAGPLLETIDIGSLIAKASGHAVEGDMDAAVMEVFSDLIKRGMVSSAAVLGSIIPGGSIVGGVAAEHLHQEYIDKSLQHDLDKYRDQQYKDKYLLQPPKQRYIDKDGKEKELPRDMFVGKDGLIHRRSKSEQDEYVRNWHKDRMQAAAVQSEAESRKMQALAIALEEKRLSPDEYIREMQKISTSNVIEIAGMTKALDENGKLIVIEPALDKDEMLANAARVDSELAQALKDLIIVSKIDKILGKVEPMRMVADCVVFNTTTVVMTFWNVGSMVAGHGRATLTSSDFSDKSEKVYRGTFSGGPDGKFVMIVDNRELLLKVVNGKYIKIDRATSMTVKERKFCEGLGLFDIRISIRTPKGFLHWDE